MSLRIRDITPGLDAIREYAIEGLDMAHMLHLRDALVSWDSTTTADVLDALNVFHQSMVARQWIDQTINDLRNMGLDGGFPVERLELWAEQAWTRAHPENPA